MVVVWDLRKNRFNTRLVMDILYYHGKISSVVPLCLFVKICLYGSSAVLHKCSLNIYVCTQRVHSLYLIISATFHCQCISCIVCY